MKCSYATKFLEIVVKIFKCKKIWKLFYKTEYEPK